MHLLGIGGLILGLSISSFAVGFFNHERNWAAYICLILFSAVAGGVYYYSIGVIGIAPSKGSQLIGLAMFIVTISQCWNFIVGPFKVIQKTKFMAQVNAINTDAEEQLKQNNN